MGRQDLLLDEGGDLLVRDGDLCVGDSDGQHLEDLFKAFMGEYRQHPAVGFGAARHVKRKDLFIPEILRDWRLQLRQDGYVDADIHYDGETGKITTEI